jgi:hypothetical protein
MNLHCAKIPQRLIVILVTVSTVCGFATTEEMAFGVQGTPSSLRIVIVAGDGGVNVIAKNHRPSRQLIIRVVNEAGRPVRGATVFFQMPPANDPGGTIGGQSAVSSVTDSAGLAETAFRPNQHPGRFEVQVGASYQGQSAYAAIAQINVQTALSRGGHDKLWRFLGIGAAAAVVTALLIDRSSSTKGVPVKQSPRG